MKPIFKWAGSKRYLASTLIPRFPVTFHRYVEPFCGSASLFFLLEPKTAILGDLNAELINALTAIREDPIAVAEMVQTLPSTKEDFYVIRGLCKTTLNATEVAARFLYLNKFCFNGLYRTNKRGEFNVPFGSKPKQYADEEILYLAASTLLHSAELRTADFEEICGLAKPGDFVYLDPPYATESSSIFTDYGARTFAVSDLFRLKHTLKNLDRRGISFMLSYADGDEMRDFSAEWSTDRVGVRRNIAGFAGHRKTATEIVIKNY